MPGVLALTLWASATIGISAFQRARSVVPSMTLIPNFELPKFPEIIFPWAPRVNVASNSGEIGINDRIAVVGASGNIGRLVALRLADLNRCKVRAVARNAGRAASFFGDLESDMEIVEADTTKPETLGSALESCEALVIVTGTTAFPTLAWRNDNTPSAVDDRGVKNVLEAWRASPGRKKRVILMSSIGVTKRKQFPFFVLNAAGVLDAKAAGEAALVEATWLESYSIVRPGQLIGGPYDNNYYLGTLAKLDRPARSLLLWDETKKDGVSLGVGDTLLGDTLRSTVAELAVMAVLAKKCPQDFSVVNVDGARPTDSELADSLSALLG
jgi:hypothetical protein